MVLPHNSTVSSVIVYQCQQSGFTPSPPDSVCVDSGTDDGMWSPDPSQVVCIIIPTATVPSMLPTTATTGEMLVLTGKTEFIDIFQWVTNHSDQACLIKELHHPEHLSLFSDALLCDLLLEEKMTF